MTPDEQFALSHKYTTGAFVLRTPTGSFAVFDHRRQLVGVYNNPSETLDTITFLSKIIDRAEPPRGFTLEDLGL